MKKELLSIMFFFSFIIGVFAQDNNENENKLIDLLTTGRFFEVKDFFLKAEKNTPFDPFFQLYYKYETAKMLNRPDSAAAFLEKLIEDGDEYWGAYKFHFYDQLLTLYTDKLQNYSKALFTCERMQQYLDENPFNVDNENIENGIKYVANRKKQIQKRENYPIIKILSNNLINKIEIKNDDEYLFFNVIYNNKTLNTVFDTGVSFFFIMNEKIADSIGVKRVKIFENDSTTINGLRLPFEEGIIDSIKIGNTLLYNIPIGINKSDILSNVPDSILNCNIETKEGLTFFSNSMSVVMGYPAMFLMKKIMIDFENKTLSFPPDTLISTTNNKESNIFEYSNNLYTRLAINNIPFTAHVDFGANSYMHISSTFYQKNKGEIPIKKLGRKKPLSIANVHKTWINIPYEVTAHPLLKFNDKIIPYTKENSLVDIYSLSDQSTNKAYDGHVGYPFFKNLGKKIVLDFKNMRIDVIE